MPRSVLGVLAAGLALALTGAGGAAPPALTFHVFAHAGVLLNGIVWTGNRFVYVQNTANVVWSAPAVGAPLTRVTAFPRESEETRCVVSPGTHGFPRGVVFCHAPDHRIYEVGPGNRMRVFAHLPVRDQPADDGALALDTSGRFGFRLVAATGRSGAGQPPGGVVFTVDAGGSVRRVGAYRGPGGADEVMVAPRGFGTAAGEVLLAADPGKTHGALVAMSPTGRTRVLATFPDGPNPIVAVGDGTPTTGTPRPGLYLTDDSGKDVYYASLAPLAAYRGDVLVGGEASGAFWVVRPRGGGFQVVPIRSSLTGKTRSLEAMLELR